MKQLRLAALALGFAAGFTGQLHAATAPLDGVYVVGAIQRLHATEPSFSFDDLRRIIDAVRPDVLVLEVRPDELAERKDTQGRPEYPAVVWPWLAAHPATALPMEPGGKAFEAMTGDAGRRFEAFAKEQPEADAYMTRLGRALSSVLQDHWRHPADAHDAVTRDLIRAQGLAQAKLGGEGFATSQAAWDGYMVDRTREAIAAHPGKRILVLASYRNLNAFRTGLTGEARLVDMEPWLREALPAASVR
ncbi:MAG: hypothetical protein KKE02_18650 [Alphaproteobacteria bacterium]|nr:hypothetical protein [Alphaproteobacteria bacterium]MBU1513006.1 hypothetical protein [Alphaproteobacteria bacterium]MBU2095114.1 hypothetical protein [Alphaproteobacteria bacterium]MBU2153047.1 hypothetical protein [Alphaproteobacteria bacterium]MBU2306365.1 hypothetical protein [Alphaproteobacteria bacterium]